MANSQKVKCFSSHASTLLKDLHLVVSTKTNHMCHVTSTQLRDYFSYKGFFLIEPMLILHSWGQVP
jgi:hypothetical protein